MKNLKNIRLTVHKRVKNKVWNIANVVEISAMFGTATAFNQDLSNWDIS